VRDVILDHIFIFTVDVTVRQVYVQAKVTYMGLVLFNGSA